MQLARVRLESVDSAVALKTAAAQLGLAEPKLDNTSAQALYREENSLLQSQRIIPLFHIPVVYGLGPNLKGWSTRQDGSWRMTDVWMNSPRISTD